MIGLPPNLVQILAKLLSENGAGGQFPPAQPTLPPAAGVLPTQALPPLPPDRPESMPPTVPEPRPAAGLPTALPTQASPTAPAHGVLGGAPMGRPGDTVRPTALPAQANTRAPAYGVLGGGPGRRSGLTSTLKQQILDRTRGRRPEFRRPF